MKELTIEEKAKPIREHNVCDFCEEKYGCVNPCSVKLIDEHVAWSEEDEKCLENAIMYCEWARDKAPDSYCYETSEKRINWLKSLKDRVQPKQDWSAPYITGAIEYTKTDAFIEKLEEYIYKQLNEGCIECGDIGMFIENMKKYMKG